MQVENNDGDELMIDGGCLCRAVRYRSSVSPVTTRLCWCRVCQYIGAGSATFNAVFKREAFSFSGDLVDYRSIADSGTAMHRRFCPHCGTHLFSEAESRPHLIIVRVGTLDKPHTFKPAATIWTSSAPPWASIDLDLPHFSGQPPP
jgi:hypothetical protein